MDCTPSLVDLFCHSFPEIDRRVVKATVLEYGNDIEAAITDLVDISDQIKETAFLDHLKVQCCSLLCPADEDVAEQQASSKEENPQVVGVLDLFSSSTTENMVPDASDSQTDVHSPRFVEPSSSVNDTLEEPTSPLIKGSKPPEKLANSIDIVNVASALECTVQEARTDTDCAFNLVKEVSDLRIKAEQERLTAQNAEIEAARGGEDLLMKACEVNKQTQKMKQDNLKLSWEIHGEKSVLALEAEELNVRLEQMKQQKEKAVTTLHELRETLQSCYDTALKDRKMAEEDKQLKEEKAGKVLEQEEEMMAVVEQETKTLKMEAETCTLLRDFLVDHGSIVDGLQGEINNLCEEVKCLKQLVQQGMRNAVAKPELARNSEALYNLKRSNSISSAASSGAMTNSSASQYSPSMEGNHQGKTQFLYGSGGGSMVAKLFNGTTEDGSFGYMNNENGGSRSNMPMQERPFIWNSYGLRAPGAFPYIYGMRDQHPPPTHGEHGKVFVDSNGFGNTNPYQAAFSAAPHGGDNNGYGYPQGVSHHLDHVFSGHGDAHIDLNTYCYPQVAMPHWSSNLDNGSRNLAGNDWVIAPKTQGSTPSGSDNFSLV